MSKSKVSLIKTDSVISEFFKQDGGITESGKLRKSYILASKWDLFFLQSIKVPLNHDIRENSRFSNRVDDAHFLAELLLFTSSIDLMARIMKKNIPSEIGATNKYFFITSAKKWFEFTHAQSNALWEIRNQIVHRYGISSSTTLYVAGGKAMTYMKKNGAWKINVSALYTKLIRAINKCEKYIESKSIKTRHKYASYIFEHGFFYVHN